jgi:hypothetical protein
MMAGFDDIGLILASLNNGVSAKEHNTMMQWAQECGNRERAQALRELVEFVEIGMADDDRQKHRSHLEK